MGELVGEMFCDAAGTYVRHASTFYPVRIGLLPYNVREYDEVRFSPSVDGLRVQRIHHWTRTPTIRRPHGFRPPEGTRVGRVTAYDGVAGRIDGTISFEKRVVKALGEGEVEVGELVEYRCDEADRVTHISGPFDTHVSQVGRNLRPRA